MLIHDIQFGFVLEEPIPTLPIAKMWTLRSKNKPDWYVLVDGEGIIYITDELASQKHGIPIIERPCMRCCYEQTLYRNTAVGKAVLALSCEIQNDVYITARAAGYRSVYR